MPSFFIDSLGCAKNQVDSEYIIALLQDKGWVLADSAEIADVIIVNTCGFINSAKQESIDTVLEFKSLFPQKKIVVAGCLSQRYGKELYEEMSEADAVVGNSNLIQVVEAVEKVVSGRRALVLSDDRRELDIKRRSRFSFPGSAYVKIAEGCDNRCAYCAIPIIRGPLLSRSVESVLDEVDFLLSSGVRELNLVAQDLAFFGKDNGLDDGLVRLVSSILEKKGDFWLRLLYIHPSHFPRELISICKNDKRFLPYFDIPFQHASSSVLSAMGRGGDRDSFLDLVSFIRSEIPNAALRSTFLLGFPGEKESDLVLLKDFLKEAALDWAGFFVYSPEEGTRAYNLYSAMPEDLRSEQSSLAERYLLELQTIQESVSSSCLDARVGKIETVLIEEKIEGEDLYLGRAFFSAPEVDGLVVVHGDDLPVGDFVRCRIVARNGIDLEALYLSE
ncbi:30S ribosomal protein S12 methylthiotransferase RimO [Spirochaetia bacterium 38H-sp]|uniref:Ribosomal protein uS12 methylthiotransferase RimO n=1 Tax=Rarispira pelagica TaxID=3141764 RepID=A0ABU9UAV8_9SPIR